MAGSTSMMKDWCSCGNPKTNLMDTSAPSPKEGQRRGERGSRADSQCAPQARQKGKKASYFHGDKVSHVFHAPDCMDHECNTCIVPFKTRKQALRAGYRPCGVCDP